MFNVASCIRAGVDPDTAVTQNRIYDDATPYSPERCITSRLKLNVIFSAKITIKFASYFLIIFWHHVPTFYGL